MVVEYIISHLLKKAKIDNVDKGIIYYLGNNRGYKFGTNNIAKHEGISWFTAYTHLLWLAKEGYVIKSKVKRRCFWMIIDY